MNELVHNILEIEVYLFSSKDAPGIGGSGCFALR